MLHPDSGYAHDSSIGPVCDVTQWTGRGRMSIGIAGLIFAALLLVSVVYVCEPSWFYRKPPPALKELNAGIRKAWKNYPLATPIGVGIGVLRWTPKTGRPDKV